MSFGGRRVVIFESRRAVEMARLVERYEGVPVSAPSMREIPVDEPRKNGGAAQLVRALRGRSVEIVILMTGVGTRALASEMEAEMPKSELSTALAGVRTFARGPKPAAALRELGVSTFVHVPEPNTWREVLASIEAETKLEGARVAVQEHGAPSVELYEALRERGAIVTPIQVYKWALPEDTAPLRAALRSLASRESRIALFTSRAQIDHASAIAAEEGIWEDVRTSLKSGMIGSIGPVCSLALSAEGLAPDIEPDHPKMGHLVKTAAEKCAAILEAKR